MVIQVSECVELLRLEKLRVNDLTIQTYPTYTLYSYVWNGWVWECVYAGQHYVNTLKHWTGFKTYFFSIDTCTIRYYLAECIFELFRVIKFLLWDTFTSRPLKRHVSLFRILKSSPCIKYALDSLKSSLLKNPLIQQKNNEKKNTNIPLNEDYNFNSIRFSS